MPHLLFDLDGVLVDNIRFETAVTSYIVEQLALKRQLSVQEAHRLWAETLVLHERHLLWHDYALHCRHLSIGDVWRTAHVRSQRLLKKFPGVDRAIDVAREFGPLWIVSDATKWVVDFKLRATLLEDAFAELFTIDRCGSDKGRDDYWQSVRDALSPPNDRVLYVENRRDRLLAAKQTIPQCEGIWINSPDHARQPEVEADTAGTQNWIVVSSHRSLATAIRTIASR